MIFKPSEMTPLCALKVAEILIEAGAPKGIYNVIQGYIKDIELGSMNVSGTEEILNDTGACLTWDGKLLPGIWLTKKALKTASERAKIYGTSTVLIRNSHHNGALAAYMLPIVESGLVPIIKSSVPSAATVAPFGGTKPLLTPDPMAIAYPTNDQPVIIDISASITTNNMISDKISKNEVFDFDCLLTAFTKYDPLEVRDRNGTVMPIGGMEYGHKGFGLALGIEALSQGLSGSGRSKKPKTMNLSTFVQVIDPEAFHQLDVFKKEMSFLSQQCLDNPPRKNIDKVRLPGQSALTKRKASLKNGITLAKETIEMLEKLSKKFRVDLPN